MSNPLLGKVKLPGSVFNLPSKGLFYKPGDVLESSVVNGEIQVKPMSALAEIKLRSADLLLSGKVIKEICQECVPEIINPEKLLTKDIDALFLFLVKSTYGAEKTIRSRHNCKNAKVHEYKVNIDTIIMNPNNQCLEHKDVLYNLILSNGQKVVLKPVNFSDSLAMVNLRQEISRKEMAREEVSNREIEDLVISDLLCVIEAVEDEVDGKTVRVTERDLLVEWARALTKKWTDEIIAASNNASEWGFKFDTTLHCKDCGEDYNYELDLNPINFFTG